MLGVPVVTSEVPSYRELSRWVLFDDWSNSVRAYARDRELAARHVREAQQYIQSTFTPARVVQQWSNVFAAVLERRKSPPAR